MSRSSRSPTTGASCGGAGAALQPRLETGSGLPASGRTGDLRAAGAAALGRLRRRKERLVAVQHHERQSDGEENALFHSVRPGRRHPPSASGHGIEPTRPERMASRKPARRQPHTFDGAVDAHGLARVVRAGRQEPTRAGEKRRQENLVERQKRERRSLGHRQPLDARRHRISGHRGPPVRVLRRKVDRKSCSRVARSGLEELASGNHDHIDSGSCPCLGVPAENLSHQAFRPIPGHGVADFSARHQPEPRFACWVRSNDERDVAAVPASSDAEGLLELGTPANPAVSAETLGLHCRRPAGAGAWWPDVD